MAASCSRTTATWLYPFVLRKGLPLGVALAAQQQVRQPRNAAFSNTARQQRASPRPAASAAAPSPSSSVSSTSASENASTSSAADAKTGGSKNAHSGQQQRYGIANEPPAHIAGRDRKSSSDDKADDGSGGKETGKAPDKQREQGQTKKETKSSDSGSWSTSHKNDTIPEQTKQKQATQDGSEIGRRPSSSSTPPSSLTSSASSASVAIGASYATQRTKREQHEHELENKVTDERAIAPSSSSSSSTESREGEEAEEKQKEEEEHPPPLSLSTVPSPAPTNNSNSNTALSTILQMKQPVVMSASYDDGGGDGSSSSHDYSRDRPPHLQAPPYMHHFDTYTLVRELQGAQFSEAQAITLMKIVRLLLGENMELARAGLVSKGDAEMENYVFRAACSELRTEMRNTRNTASTRARSERMQLQHELDILSQRLSSETSGLRDELKGMFDDRKMAVRTDRRDVENKVHELNYEITSRLGSEMRQEVEALRWVLVRRIAIAITCVAAMVIAALRVAKYEDDKKEKLRSAAHATAPGAISAADPAGNAIAGDGEAGAVAAAASGESVALVPLG